jgi:multimeric flavodoxin WrbA
VNILGINGSPHLEGNTAYALRYALEVIDAEGTDAEGIETVYLSLADKTIAPCRGCFACREGACVQKDDMVAITEAILGCDGLLLASPVYMGLMTGQMKVMMDRTVLFRTGGRFSLSGKVGAGIACGAFRNGGQELTLQAMHTYFLQQDMYAIADGPRYSHSGAAVAGRAETDQVGLQTVENVARRLARAVKQLRGH